MKSANSKYARWLFALLLFKSVVIGTFIYVGIIGLGPDEAQYWTWSQQLSFGYYSKPPGIAWQIALGTSLFGNTEFGVRFGALVIGFLLPFAVYALARGCHLESRTAFWAALVMAFSPLGILASLLAITDGGMVLFWALALVAVCRALTANKPLPYYWLGAFIVCGALFKWPMYLFWVFVLFLILWKKESFSWRLIGGILLSLLGLMPSVAWNIQHDFATFRHVASTIHGPETVDVGTTTLLKGNLLEFIGAQSLLLSPLLFLCLIGGLIALCRDKKLENSALKFCGILTLSILLAYGFYSIFKKMQGNWCDFVYPSASVVIAWYCCEKSKKAFSWMVVGAVSSICLVVALLAFPQPFKHNLGWTKLQTILPEAGYNPAEHFIFGDKYQMTSILSFYAPQQKRAYFLNLNRIRKNQFSYWPGMEVEQVGKDGFFVAAERFHKHINDEILIKQYAEALKPYFSEVRFKGKYTLVSWGDVPIKKAYIFECIRYNGKLPPETVLY